MSTPADTLVICVTAANLREGSYDHALLRAAQEVAPAGMEIRIFGRIAPAAVGDGGAKTSFAGGVR